ncbi:MAG: hypothetical protein SVX43_07755 [Cyanobacteriota bacterium]|nr:hypothetical protein [Cyanobacteriota bacterium]
MTLETERLQISPTEIENTIDLDVGTSVAVDFYRAFFCKNRKSFLSVVTTECAICFLVFVFVMSVSLIVNRAAGNLSNTAAEGRNFFSLLAVIVFSSFIALNLYLGQRVKQVESLAKLLEEIDRYNRAIGEIAIVEQLHCAGSQQNTVPNREKLIDLLQNIRQSLMDALKVEKIARTRQDLFLNRHELLTRLEGNLTALVASELDERATQYNHLLEETLRVGLAVRGEVQKLKKRL